MPKMFSSESMSYRMFDIFSLPLFAVTFSSILNKKWSTRMAYLHLIVCFVLIFVYLYLRHDFSKNKPDPLSDALDDKCCFFDQGGVHYLHYSPSIEATRVVIMFPGVKVGVRRMLREDIMKPFLRDSIVIGFQCRGLGESDLSVHLTPETMLTDSINAYAYVLRQNITELPVHIVGYSLGGFNALNLCNTIRDCCESITIVGTMYDTENMSALFKVACSILGISNKDLCHVGQPVIIVHSIGDEDVGIGEAKAIQNVRFGMNLPTCMLLCEGSHSKYSISDEDLKRYKSTILYIEDL